MEISGGFIGFNLKNEVEFEDGEDRKWKQWDKVERTS